ncbi:MAG: dehydrogenase E1 component subunit alpha/beta [Bacteroidota bacterium]
MQHAAASATARNLAQPPVHGAGPSESLPKERLLTAYRNILTARFIDTKILVLLKQGKVFFHIGGSGHEAVQTALALALKPGSDWAYPYYRDLAFSLQFGYTIEEVMREALHRDNGPSSGGFSMPFHYGHKKWRIVAQSSPTGTQFLQAVGTALGARMEGKDEVVYVSSGEGATSEGEFHEAMNWASREKLPVVFLVQNNKYAISVHVQDQTAGGSVYEMTAGYQGLNRFKVDGCDFPAAYNVAAEAVHRARTGAGPSLIEADVVRLLPHSSSDDQRKYRDAKDLEEDLKRDPVPRMEHYLIERELLRYEEIDAIKHEIQENIEQAADRAMREKVTDPANVVANVYAPAVVRKEDYHAPGAGGKSIVMVDAINHALAEELERDPRLLVYGEDVGGKKGGVFTATKGLSERFGEGRVFNSPLAEASIIGTAFGLSVRGTYKPVVEIQFGDYIWPGFMQIRDEVAMLRYRSNSQWSCPMVIRVAVGGYIHGGLYHSQSIDGFFTHIPGVRVVYPSNAADAKGLLKTACRENDPVMFLEHKGLYRQSFASSPEPGPDYLLPLGIAAVKAPGDDITVITWGMMVQRSLDAAVKVSSETGASIEVIDIRTLNPFDKDTVLASVRKTGKALIVHEDTLTSGFGAEIAAIIAAEAFERLDAPVMRVAAKDAPVPYGPLLENAMLPQEKDVVDALTRLVKY